MDLLLNWNGGGPVQGTKRSSMDQIFLQPESYQVISIAMGLKNPNINVDAIKADLSRSIMVKHPRFSSLLVKKGSSGRDEWRRTHVNIDDHVILVDRYQTWRAATSADSLDDDEAVVNAYLAELAVRSPLSTEKPLWEVHILLGLACVVLRVHHAIGDGTSLMSMLSACFGGGSAERRKAGGGGDQKKSTTTGRRNSTCSSRIGLEGGVWGIADAMRLNAEFETQLAAKLVGVKDDKTVLRCGVDGVQYWPRMLATSRFKLDDFKQIKQVIPGATLNDVFMGVISSGLSKYLEAKSPKALLERPHITACVVANLRKHSGLQEMSKLMNSNSGSPPLGNWFGTYLVPLYCSPEPVKDPLEPVRHMKKIMDQKKQSFEAEISYELMELSLSILGPAAGSWLYNRLLESTTLVISNMVGPSEEIAIAGNPVAYLRVNISSCPQAVTLHMVSYAGRADLQISVAKYIIPDVEFLAKCFEDSLARMTNLVNYKMASKAYPVTPL